MQIAYLVPKKMNLAPKKPVHRITKRAGIPTQAEKEFVAQIVQDQPAAMTPRQVRALATTLRRSKEVVKSMVEQAKENFVCQAERYVEIHAAATEAALAEGDNEQALKGSQWALTNISAEGTRIIDKIAPPATGSKIMIGIQMGGGRTPEVLAIEAPKE